MRKRLRSHEGANAVEFALVLPILVMLIFGAITAGLTLNSKQQLDHAAREGARFGATLAYEDDICGAGTDWDQCVHDRVVATAVGQLDTTVGGDGGVCVSYVDAADTPHSSYYGTGENDFGNTDPGTACVEEDPSLDTTGARVHVRITRPGRLDAVFVRTEIFNIVSKSISRHEDD